MSNNNQSTTEALEPTLEDLALEAASLLDTLPTYVSDRTLCHAQQMAFALRTSVAHTRSRTSSVSATVDDEALRKRARQIIDAVVESPCIVEVRFFSQAEEADKLEDRIVALLRRRSPELPVASNVEEVVRLVAARVFPNSENSLAIKELAKGVADHFAAASPVAPQESTHKWAERVGQHNNDPFWGDVVHNVKAARETVAPQEQDEVGFDR